MEAVTGVLLAALVACVLTLVLAALLLLAERYLANYGICSIDINNGEKKLEVTGGESLLASLKSNGIFIPSACGGRGTCAYCKVKVFDGAGPVVPTEAPLLSAEEIESNVRISCQVKVRNDLAIEIPEELFRIKEFRGEVERITDLTHDIKELRIRLIEPETIDFRAGQYIQLQAPAYGDNPEPVYRAYSISSKPSDNRYIELMIRLVPGGICTTWVFEHLNEGDEVIFSGPYGEFELQPTDREMVWIAGGSGMAPFWSMIRHMKENDIRKKCTYFFGAVNPRDMFLTDELQALSGELEWFEYVPALSCESPPEDWEGDTGLITDVLDRRVHDGEEMEAYLCGSPGMIDAAAVVLKDKGITEEHTFYDKFA
ncbi:MAG: NADH:ubiquinone reductase (Na(+)-transporting) subunit F [Phycisphaerae bacterium]